MALPFPIVDAHIHLWDPRTTPRAVTPAVRLLGWNERVLRAVGARLFPKASIDFVGRVDHVMHPYLPGSHRRDRGEQAFRGFVHVQAGWHGKGPLGPVGETRWLEEVCGQDLLAIVGQADLASPGLGTLLDAHAEASARFVGVRDMLARDPDPGVMDWDERPAGCADPDWERGFAELGRRGLTFDAWMYAPQLPAFEAVARAHPETRVVLDHLGSPVGIGGPFAGYGATAEARESIRKRWEEDLRRIAEQPQVHVKVSGLAMPISGWGWHQRAEPPSVDEVIDAFGPLVEVALDAFGVERCLFASNFPMDKAALPWSTLYAAFEALIEPMGPEAQRAVFHDNAARFYGLDGAPSAE